MLLAFFDEFGDFSEQPEATHKSWRPICGYAGFILPASRYSEFCEKFAFLYLDAAKNVSFGRQAALDALQRKSYAEFSSGFKIAQKEMYSKYYEAKGSDVFSGAYIANDRRSAAKKRGIIRRANRFISLIGSCDGSIIYFGIDKHKYFTDKKIHMKRRLHVELIRGAVIAAYAEAKKRNKCLQMVFDHHGVDDDTGERIKFRNSGFDPAGNPKIQTRQEYCHEIMMENQFFHFFREPLFPIRSHWSLGIQSADWACSLLTKIKIYEHFSDAFPQHKMFYEKLSSKIESISTRDSTIFRLHRQTPTQLVLPDI